MMKAKDREAMTAIALGCGLYLRTWSPGDGVTRYRFFRADSTKPETQSYYGPADPIATFDGARRAWIFLRGYSMGYAAPKPEETPAR